MWHEKKYSIGDWLAEKYNFFSIGIATKNMEMAYRKFRNNNSSFKDHRSGKLSWNDDYEYIGVKDFELVNPATKLELSQKPWTVLLTRSQSQTLPRGAKDTIRAWGSGIPLLIPSEDGYLSLKDTDGRFYLHLNSNVYDCIVFIPKKSQKEKSGYNFANTLKENDMGVEKILDNNQVY